MAYDLVHEVIMQSAAAATGNGTSFVCDTGGFNDLVMQVTGTFSGTITFEASVDGTNYAGVQVTKLSDSSAVSTTTTTGLFRMNVSGIYAARARISAYTSGSITVVGRAQA